jgi:hypothetical protein
VGALFDLDEFRAALLAPNAAADPPPRTRLAAIVHRPRTTPDDSGGLAASTPDQDRPASTGLMRARVWPPPTETAQPQPHASKPKPLARPAHIRRDWRWYMTRQCAFGVSLATDSSDGSAVLRMGACPSRMRSPVLLRASSRRQRLSMSPSSLAPLEHAHSPLFARDMYAAALGAPMLGSPRLVAAGLGSTGSRLSAVGVTADATRLDLDAPRSQALRMRGPSAAAVSATVDGRAHVAPIAARSESPQAGRQMRLYSTRRIAANTL